MSKNLFYLNCRNQIYSPTNIKSKLYKFCSITMKFVHLFADFPEDWTYLTCMFMKLWVGINLQVNFSCVSFYYICTFLGFLYTFWRVFLVTCALYMDSLSNSSLQNSSSPDLSTLLQYPPTLHRIYGNAVRIFTYPSTHLIFWTLNHGHLESHSGYLCTLPLLARFWETSTTSCHQILPLSSMDNCIYLL